MELVIQEEQVHGGITDKVGVNASNDGGTGGYGYVDYGRGSASRSGSGAGNPAPNSIGGNGTAASWLNARGTGGLLIIYATKINNTSIINANGIAGGTTNSSGGASGGGSINIFYQADYLNTGYIEAFGGNVNYTINNGGPGGSGSISVGNISTGTYESTYTNY